MSILVYIAVAAATLNLFVVTGLIALLTRNFRLTKKVSNILWFITEILLVLVLVIKLCYSWTNEVVLYISLGLVLGCLTLTSINVLYRPVEVK